MSVNFQDFEASVETQGVSFDAPGMNPVKGMLTVEVKSPHLRCGRMVFSVVKSRGEVHEAGVAVVAGVVIELLAIDEYM